MKVLVFGSANIDKTYTIDHFVDAGETVSADKMELFCGGKGFNQAVAFSRAGCDTYFAGAVGSDGDILKSALSSDNISLKYLKTVSGPSGHAIIQVDPDGQNSIIILAGANGEISRSDVDSVISGFGPGDLIVLQNEISNVGYIIEKAKDAGLVIALNPSPYNEKVASYDLSKVDYLLINEVEGEQISGSPEPDKILNILHCKYPDMNILLTLGCRGSAFMSSDGEITCCGIYKTTAVDTTAAGDTFTGYFLSGIISDLSIKESLERAAIASGISVSRKGASPSIPYKNEVDKCSLSEVIGDL